MANYFLKVDKGLFNIGLNPTEILLLAQIAEFQTNTGDCFISDKVLAANFGVSESTITRALKNLEGKGFITRNTKVTNTGKERHIIINMSKIEEYAASIKMTDAKEHASVKMTDAQASNCLMRKQQNDLIKDNLKDKEIDNICVLERKRSKTETAPGGSFANSEPVVIADTVAKPMTRDEATAQYGLTACANRIAAGIANCYWISGELVTLLD